MVPSTLDIAVNAERLGPVEQPVEVGQVEQAVGA